MTNMLPTSRMLLAYTLALGVIATLLVKVINLPALLSGAPMLVAEYYGPWWTSMALDWFLVGLYIWVGSLFARVLRLSLTQGTAAASLAISGAFCVYFLLSPPTPKFFSRWFRAAGVGAVVYDIVFVTATAALYQWLERHLP